MLESRRRLRRRVPTCVELHELDAVGFVMHRNRTLHERGLAEIIQYAIRNGLVI